MFAQFMHLSSAERKTLLVAGAAGGMSATFAAPIARPYWRLNSCCLSGSHEVSFQLHWRAPRLLQFGAILSALGPYSRSLLNLFLLDLRPFSAACWLAYWLARCPHS